MAPHPEPPTEHTQPAAPAMAAVAPAQLGRLVPVPARDVWPHEAHHFTPWLLQNADVLSDLLGMELDLHTAEHPVGDFSLDLIGKDVTTGETVIVENQLETSDHIHLGQILTYAAGTDPTTIVWVAAGFRPEHRAALDWLNNRTDENTRFFGVELGVVRIGDSSPAPSFRLIAQPNDWEKTVRAATQAEGLSPRQELYHEFWTRWLHLIKTERTGWTRGTKPPRDSWFTMTAGTSGVTYYASFTRSGLCSELRFEAPDAALNTRRYQQLHTHAPVMEASYGAPLEWDELPEKKSTRVAEYLPNADITHRDEWDTYLQWLLDRQTRLRQALQTAGGVPDGTPTVGDLSQ